MRILEARDGFIKIESNESLPLSAFLQVNDREKRYIAQVIKTQKANDSFLILAKLLFLYDGSLLSYDYSLPSKDAKLINFSFDAICQSFKASNPVLIGKHIENRANIEIDKTSFNKKTLISAETDNFNEIMVSNLKQELSKFSNTFVVDMRGLISSQKYIAGKDFRLPLNCNSLEFIYQDCLNDATSDSKTLVKEIFKDLAEYAQTVPFLPFGTLKTIVDDMVDNSHIFKLLVLKNKLTKFDKMGYFAANSSEADNLTKILSLQSAYIDLSKLDPVFQNRYLETIYKNLNKNSQIIVIASNNISKNNLKTIIKKEDIASTLVVHPRFKYINEIKTMFKNYIVEPSFINNEIFKKYGTLLSSIQKDSFLIVGEATNYLPLVSVLEKTPEVPVVINNNDNDDILEELVESNTQEPAILNDYEVIIEKDEKTEAIEKKSEELIEKLGENLETIPSGNDSLFDDETTVTEDIPNTNNFNIIEKIEDSVAEENIDENSIEEATEDENTEFTDTEIIESKPSESNQDFHTNIDEIQTIEVSDEILEMAEEAEILSTEEIETNDVIEVEEQDAIETSEDEIIELEEIPEINDNSDDEFKEIIIEYNENETIEDNLEEAISLDEEPASSPLEVIPINNEDLQELEEIVELEDAELEDEDIIVEIDTEEENELVNDIEKEIIEDVDKVFTTIKDESLSDADLDLIDELNNESLDENEFEELTELEEIEEEQELDFVEPIEEISDSTEIPEEKEILETKSSSTPNIPVYNAEIPAEDTVVSDPLEQGDNVMHAKYGVGVVEKMIKYGNKTLFSINFENVGRRLLDPSLTEIKKI